MDKDRFPISGTSTHHSHCLPPVIYLQRHKLRTWHCLCLGLRSVAEDGACSALTINLYPGHDNRLIYVSPKILISSRFISLCVSLHHNRHTGSTRLLSGRGRMTRKSSISTLHQKHVLLHFRSLPTFFSLVVTEHLSHCHFGVSCREEDSTRIDCMQLCFSITCVLQSTTDSLVAFYDGILKLIYCDSTKELSLVLGSGTNLLLSFLCLSL